MYMQGGNEKLNTKIDAPKEQGKGATYDYIIQNFKNIFQLENSNDKTYFKTSFISAFNPTRAKYKLSMGMLIMFRQ